MLTSARRLLVQAQAQARASPAPKPRNKATSAKSKSRSVQLASSTAGSPAPSPGPSSLANEVYPESSPAPSAVVEAPPEPEAPDYSFLPDIAPSEYHHPRLAPTVPRPRLPPAFEAYVPPRRSRFDADGNDSSSSDEDEEDLKRREQRRKAQAAAARERRLKAAKGGRGRGGAAEEEDDRLYCICQTLYDPEVSGDCTGLDRVGPPAINLDLRTLSISAHDDRLRPVSRQASIASRLSHF